MTQSLVRPFTGLRPTAEYAARVAAPPYDVLTSAEARTMAAGNPWSFLHVSKPEIDLPPDTDPHADAVYAKAAETLKRMVAEGVLVRDAVPVYYVYRAEVDGHAQTGIVCGGSVAAYHSGRIRRHEHTHPDKEADRVRQIDALNAATGPVMTAHRADPVLARIIAAVTQRVPAYGVTGAGGVRHTLWVVDDAREIAAIGDAFDAMDAIYIADGHHRSAAAARVAASRGAANPGHTGREPYNYFLIVSFPADEMRILDYNRVVGDLNGLSAGEFLARMDGDFVVETSPVPARPSRAGEFGMYLDGSWYRLRLRDDAPAGDPVADLDISRLSARCLGPILAVGDPRTDRRIDFVGGIRGLEDLERRVDGGEWAVAFALFPTALSDLMAVADAGGVMPPKSTWFEPKLADGLVSLVLD